MDAASPATPATHRTAPVPERPIGAPEGVESSAFRRMTAPRWTAMTASAVIALVAFGIGADRVMPGPATPATVIAAVSATVIRNEGESALAPGTELEPGDTVIADSLGSVILRFGSREARLAGGASVRIDELGNGGVVIEQLDGRVYHRMFGTDAGSYVVATGSVTWTAIGRAFDLDREPVHGSTLERVTGTAVDRSVSLVGPSLAGTLVEGRQAVVLLGTETPEVSTAETPATWFADPWVASNARQDRAAAEAVSDR